MRESVAADIDAVSKILEATVDAVERHLGRATSELEKRWREYATVSVEDSRLAKALNVTSGLTAARRAVSDAKSHLARATVDKTLGGATAVANGVAKALQDPRAFPQVLMASTLGLGGLLVGVPFLPGVTDNVLLGIAGAAFPFLSDCLLYTSPSPRDATLSRMPSSA